MSETKPTRSRAEAQRRRAEEYSRGSGPARYLREVVGELRKVVWPSQRELVVYTTVVIVFVTFMVALVSVLDLVAAQGVLAIFG